MRYLKLYEAYDIETIKKDIEHLLSDLSDSDILVECNYQLGIISIRIGDVSNETKRRINIKEWSDDLFAVNDYLIYNGYKFSSFSFRTSDNNIINPVINFNQNYFNTQLPSEFDSIFNAKQTNFLNLFYREV